MPAPVKMAEAAAQQPMLYDTLVQGIELPPSVVAAINRKLEQYYLVGEYGFRVEREQKESERKVIEANGIAEFQKIVSQGISDSYLRWRGIEATLELSQSKNAKVVVIGSGRDGLPIILGNVDSAPALRAETGDVEDGLKGATPAKTVVSGSGTDAAVTVAPGSRLSVGKPSAGESGNTGTATPRIRSSSTTTLYDLVCAADRSRGGVKDGLGHETSTGKRRPTALAAGYASSRLNFQSKGDRELEFATQVLELY